MEEEFVVTEVKRDVKHIPGFIKIVPRTGGRGLWEWDIYFSEGEFRNNRVVPWTRTDREPRSIVMEKIITNADLKACGNPVPHLYRLLLELDENDGTEKAHNRIYLGDLAETTVLDVVGITMNTLAVYIRRESHGIRKTAEPFDYSFIIPKKNLYVEVYNALKALFVSDVWYYPPDDEEGERDNFLINYPEPIFEADN